MKRLPKALKVVLFLVLALLLCAGLGGGLVLYRLLNPPHLSRNELVGTYRTSNLERSQSLDLKADGTFVQIIHQGQGQIATNKGTWRVYEINSSSDNLQVVELQNAVLINGAEKGCWELNVSCTLTGVTSLLIDDDQNQYFYRVPEKRQDK